MRSWSAERVAAAAGARLVTPSRPPSESVDEPLLSTHLETLPDGVETVTFGAGGDVHELPESLEVALSELRGQRRELPGGLVVIDDCYNANPMSMRAALDDLAASTSGRRVAVLDLLVTVGPLAATMGPVFGGQAVAVERADVVVGLEVVAQGLAA